MSKSKRTRQKKSKKRASDKAAPSGSNEPGQMAPDVIQALQKSESQLKDEMKGFRSGDFVKAQQDLAAAAMREDLSAETRQRAADLEAATRPERTAILVGMACATLLILIFIVSQLTQP